MTSLRIRAGDGGRPVSPTLFGLFLEDINFACDGGLNANLVNNHSFEGVYERGGAPVDTSVPLDRRPRSRARLDRARHWRVSGGTLVVRDVDPVAAGGHYARVTSEGLAVLENDGYPGGEPGIAVRRGTSLELSAIVRTDGLSGGLLIRLVDDSGVVAAQDVRPEGTGWHRVTALLRPTRTASCTLQVVLHGAGVLDLDEVRLVPEDHWGAGDPRWSQGLLRRDLVEALGDLAPRFVRFPGGCVVEGASAGNQYRWKDTVGPLERRRPDYNLWGAHRPAGDYSQSYQVGFYEYFLLCEDLGAEPVPVVWAGMHCQFRTDETVPFDDPAFDEVVQDVLDLVDWARADPADSPWAALRAEAGHPEPFTLRYLAIGNENHGPEYFARFERMRGAVEAHHPDITLILSAGPYADGPAFDRAWEHADGRPELVVDEHFYRDPDWFVGQTERYDGYRRDGARVFLGEYAAHVQRPGQAPGPNTWGSALAEAAFLTGVVRNSDVVMMASYAPLLNLLDHGQWEHNLLDFDRWRVHPTPNARVQRLLATHLGTRVVPVDGVVPADLHVVATADDAVCHVVLVNVGQERRRVVLQVDDVTVDRATSHLLRAGPGSGERSPVDEGCVGTSSVLADVPVRQGRLETDVPARSVLVLTVPPPVSPGACRR